MVPEALRVVADAPIALGVRFAEAGLLPDPLVRRGIRRFVRRRIREEWREDPAERGRAKAELVARLRADPIALEPELPNEQHYELPPEFFQAVLGRWCKYSCGLWNDGPDEDGLDAADPETTDPLDASADPGGLDAAEEAMLHLTCERADIRDGQDILDLGCGWGSFTLWAAEHYPASRIVAVSNSVPQGRFIEAECERRGLTNVSAITADMNEYFAHQRFDRVVSVEMFEHMRNYERLLSRIGAWLKPNGKLFVHIFCHRELAYPFEIGGLGNWMARLFFTGGLMPSEDLLFHFQNDLTLETQWRMSGAHYRRTAEAWLARLDASHDTVIAIFEDVYSPRAAHRWFRRWRLFFLAVAELFGHRGGEEWGVAHYRFVRRPTSEREPV